MRALDGLRVLDLTRLVPGPLGSLVLADLGAQVDKVEDPHGGDYLRHMPPHLGETNAAFLALNRGKRSIVLDLKQPEGRALFERILPRYDVLFEQFRPGVLDRLGLSHARLRQSFPRLVIAALTGYGQTGPLAHRAGHDLNYLARSGLLGLMGPADRPPQPPSFQLADVAGGMWAAIGILAALRARDVTGEGSIVDIAMSEGTLPFAAVQWGTIAATGTAARGGEPLTGGIAPYGTYATKDGKFVALGALEPKFWRAFCDAAEIEFDMSAMLPGDHQPEWRARLEAIFAGKTRDEWAAIGAARDCCLEPVLAPDEIVHDDHLRVRGVLHGEQVRLPVGEPSRTPPPKMGEHTDAILSEAGLAADEIARLRAAGVVR